MVIQGAGGLGIQAAAVAKDMGAATVIVVDQIPGRLELARAFGADHTINLKEVPDRQERVKLVRQWTGGVGADVACDFVGFPAGDPRGHRDAARRAAPISRSARSAAGPRSSSSRRSLVWGSKKIVGVIQYDPWVIPRALDFLVRNRDALAVRPHPLPHVSRSSRSTRPSPTRSGTDRDTTTITRAALAP